MPLPQPVKVISSAAVASTGSAMWRAKERMASLSF
jgi:hypothetical protein